MSTAAAARKSSQLEIQPMSAALGAEVLGCDVRELTPDAVTKIRKALADHLILLLRGQRMNEEEQTAFTANFGVPAKAPRATLGVKERDARYPCISIVSNVKENGVPIGSLGDGEAFWHTDTSYVERPPGYTTFIALEVPPHGGNTQFTNMYAALDTLPKEIFDTIKDKDLKHDSTYNAAGQLHVGASPTNDVVTCPGTVHPLVRTHADTGQNALYLGRRSNAYIMGMPVAESEALLDLLWRHATRPELTWTQTWRVGDVLVWDNQCLMHRRDAFDGGHGRIMHKAYCEGTKPFRSAEAFSRPAHPRARRAVLNAAS